MKYLSLIFKIWSKKILRKKIFKILQNVHLSIQISLVKSAIFTPVEYLFDSFNFCEFSLHFGEEKNRLIFEKILAHKILKFVDISFQNSKNFKFLKSQILKFPEIRKSKIRNSRIRNSKIVKSKILKFGDLGFEKIRFFNRGQQESKNFQRILKF